MKYKKGIISFGMFSFLVIIGLVLLIFGFGAGGGALIAYKITQTIQSVPKPVWIGLIILILFLILKKK